MAADNEILINTLLEIRDSVDNLKKIERSSKKAADGIESNFKKAGVAIAAVFGGAAVIRGVRSLVNGIEDVIRAASVQEDAVNKLNAALRVSGSFSEAASEDFQEYARSLQSVTRFGDEVILQQLALAKSFGATNEQAKEIVEAGLNLAEAFGQTAEFGIRNVAKTLGGLAGELGEILPDIKQLTQEQLRNGEGIDLIRKKYAGFAQLTVKTFSGALEQANNTFGDLQETIGAAITQSPELIVVINEISKSFENLSKDLNEDSGFSSFFADIISLGNKLVSYFNNIGAFFGAIVSTITKLAGIVVNVAGFIKDVATKDLETAIKNFNDAGRELDNLANKFINPFVEINDLTRRIEAGLRRVGSATRSLGSNGNAAAGSSEPAPVVVPPPSEESVKEFSNSFVSNLTKEVSKETTTIAQSLLSGITAGADGAAKFASTLTGAIGDAIVPGVGGAVSELVSFLSQGPEQVKATIDAFFAELPNVLTRIVEALPQLFVSIVENLDPFFEAINEKLPIAVENAVLYFVDNIDRVIAALVRRAPFFATTVSQALAAKAPFIAIEVAQAFVKEVPNMAKEFVTALIDELKDKIDSVFDGLNPFGNSGVGGAVGSIGDTIGGVVSDVGDFFGFADGGIVPGGAPFTDRVPSLLTPGEMVVDRDLTRQLARYLENQQDGGRSENMNVTLQVGESELANVMLDLKRRGYRIA